MCSRVARELARLRMLSSSLLHLLLCVEGSQDVLRLGLLLTMPRFWSGDGVCAADSGDGYISRLSPAPPTGSRQPDCRSSLCVMPKCTPPCTHISPSVKAASLPPEEGPLGTEEGDFPGDMGRDVPFLPPWLFGDWGLLLGLLC